MTSPKSIVLKSIPRSIADPFIKEHHYSKSVVKNSQLSFGVFFDDYLHGVIQYGPSMDKSKVIGLVRDTKTHELEKQVDTSWQVWNISRYVNTN